MTAATAAPGPRGRSLSRAFRPPLLALVYALSLGGCVESFPGIQVVGGDIRNELAQGRASSARGVTVAIASLDGAPVQTVARFNTAFAKAAPEREITMADAASAHYLVRGYLSAEPAEGGTAVTYLYDIFDANDQQRIGRVTDVLTTPGSEADAWAVVDDRVMDSLAGRSADALASALATTPAAQAELAPVITASTASPPLR